VFEAGVSHTPTREPGQRPQSIPPPVEPASPFDLAFNPPSRDPPRVPERPQSGVQAHPNGRVFDRNSEATSHDELIGDLSERSSSDAH
jgi:hypothetical protein